MIDTNGNLIKHGDVIQWHVGDNDDNKVWTFLGIVYDYTQLDHPFYNEKQYVKYLGGGIDFGMAIGKVFTFEEVMQDSEDNEAFLQGVKVLGKCSEIPKIIKTYYGE